MEVQGGFPEWKINSFYVNFPMEMVVQLFYLSTSNCAAAKVYQSSYRLFFVVVRLPAGSDPLKVFSVLGDGIKNLGNAAQMGFGK